MQRKAAGDLRQRVTNALVDAGLTYEVAKEYWTPRRLTLDIRGLTPRSADISEEKKGPRTDAPEQAIAGFLRGAGLASVDQAQVLETTARPASGSTSETTPGSRDELRKKWEAMTDVHQFFGILRSLNLTRRQALSMVGDDLAWRLDRDAVSAMMMQAAQDEMPIMCFVGNKGCIQIHSGPVANIKTMGPWLNVMDPGFHLHLRTDRIAELWGVRKPNSDGHVTSLEAYDADGTMVIQFFGKRHEGKNERPDWRRLAEQLPRLPDRTAA